MKAKFKTDGNQYKLLVKKFPFLWWTDELPAYDSLEEIKRKAFEIYGILPQEFINQKSIV